MRSRSAMITMGTAPNTAADRQRESADDGGRARQRALRQSRDLHADEGDCAAVIRTSIALDQGDRAWNRCDHRDRSRPRSKVFLQRDRASRLHVHVDLEILEAGHANFDLVPALFEPELLERAVEVVDESRVVAIDEHLRIARPNPSAGRRRSHSRTATVRGTAGRRSRRVRSASMRVGRCAIAHRTCTRTAPYAPKSGKPDRSRRSTTTAHNAIGLHR